MSEEANGLETGLVIEPTKLESLLLAGVRLMKICLQQADPFPNLFHYLKWWISWWMSGSRKDFMSEILISKEHWGIGEVVFCNSSTVIVGSCVCFFWIGMSALLHPILRSSVWDSGFVHISSVGVLRIGVEWHLFRPICNCLDIVSYFSLDSLEELERSSCGNVKVRVFSVVYVNLGCAQVGGLFFYSARVFHWPITPPVIIHCAYSGTCSCPM